jgi:hypothetical protein
MTKHSGGATTSRGGASKPTQREQKLRGEKASPADCERGETATAEEGSPADLDAAHDRAS